MKNAVQSLVRIFKQLNYILTKNQKKKSIGIFFAILIGAGLETVGISIIMPFVQSMLSPEELMRNPYVEWIAMTLNITDAYQMVLCFAIVVIIIYFLKNIYLIALSYVRSKYSCNIQKELSVRMMKIYLSKDYIFFSGVNSSELLRSIGEDVNRVYNILSQLFKIIAEILTTLMICMVILFTDYKMAIAIILLAGICMLGVTLGFRNIMKRMGRLKLEYDSKLKKHAYQAFQGIKEVLVMHRQSFFAAGYESAYANQQKAVVSETVANESPAYIIEAICVSGLISMVAVRVFGGVSADELLPQLTLFAVGAFRILPSISRITSSFNIVAFNLPGFDVLYESMHKINLYENETQGVNTIDDMNGLTPKILPVQNIHLKQKLTLEGIYWKYPAANEEVISGIDMTIAKGSSIGLIGPSGAGKTTLADIILGLIVPNHGKVCIDGIDIQSVGESWHTIIAYVPQTVFLTDDSIRSNVAFGITTELISDEMVWNALEQAQLADFVRSLPQGLDTEVGERGVRFSGGQRQRIAIARALYMNPDILVLDEATSALDNETESAVMQAIEELQGHKTLIIVAHRLSTIQKCDFIYEISEGKAVKKSGIS